MPLTERMQQVWDLYQRHGGDGTVGAQTATARELGISNAGVKSAVDAYRRYAGLGEPPARPHKAPTATQQARGLMERQEAVEAQLAALVAAHAALSVDVRSLTELVRGMLARQPLVLEVRPTHRRKVDGGEGGRREGRRSFRELEEVSG